ncbi:Protein turtle [Nymphon striatum]|nr:Protein turtle [Nymphon striatum]
MYVYMLPSYQNISVSLQYKEIMLFYTCELDFPDSVPVPYIVQWRKNKLQIPIYIWYKGYPPHHGKGYDGRVSLSEQASLNMTNVQQADQGLYECKIVYLNRAPSAQGNGTLLYLEVLAPPHFDVRPPETTYTTIGDTLDIQCSASGTPSPTIEWYKAVSDKKNSVLALACFLQNPPHSKIQSVSLNDLIGFGGKFDGTLLYNKGNIEISSKRLRIKGIQKTDVAEYTCKAVNKEGEVSTSTKVIVAGGAVITIPPHNITLLEGNQAEFICESKALPSNVTHRWYRNDIPISDLSWMSQRISVRESDGTLIIERTTSDDSGKYSCEVTNGIGQQQTAFAYLDVQYPARVTYNPSVQYLPLGLPGILRCFYESNPPITHVRWTKDNRKILPDSAMGIETLRNNGSLFFEKIKDEHQGRYTCAPYNIHGTAGLSNIMEVLVRPPPMYVTKPLDKYQRLVNSDVKMECQGSGNPTPKIYWRKVNKNIFVKADGRELPKGRWSINDGTLSLKGLKKQDHGHYECVLMNEIATLVTSTLLIVEGTTPHAPTNVSVNTSTHAATLTWLPAYDGGFKQRYIISYKFADQGDNAWKKIMVPGDTTVFTIHSLLQNTKYDFKVQSKNELGEGMSSRVVRATTKYSVFPTDLSGAYPSHLGPGAPVPGQPVGMIAKSSSTIGQVVIQWKSPVNLSVPISYYTIEHSLKATGPWKQLEGIISPPITKLTLFSVESGKMHYYRVKAHYLSYSSIASKVAEVFVPAAPTVDKQKAITAGVVGGLLFFIVAMILAICAVKICNNRKRRKAEKAYMMVTCPGAGVNGNHLPSPVPLKKSREISKGRVSGLKSYLLECCDGISFKNIRLFLRPMLLIQPSVLTEHNSSHRPTEMFSNQHPHQLHESFGHEQELEMLPRRWRRFPKAVRYNVQMEYSQPPGWIRRTPEGKFVLNGAGDDDEDDGGFLTGPHVSVSPLYQVLNDSRQNLYVNSAILNGDSSQSITIKNHSPRIFHLSGNSSQSFGRGEIPICYSPRDPRYRTSSPGFIQLEGFRPLFSEDLSSVMHPSSVERSFPSMISRKITPSIHHTPTGYSHSASPSFHQELPSLQVIHENLHRRGQQFRPIHCPIPQQRRLQYHLHEQDSNTNHIYPKTPSPYLRKYEHTSRTPQNHIHIPQPHQFSYNHFNTGYYPKKSPTCENDIHIHIDHRYPLRNNTRVASAPLPSEMIQRSAPKISHPRTISRLDRTSPSSRPMSAQYYTSHRPPVQYHRSSPGPQILLSTSKKRNQVQDKNGMQFRLGPPTYFHPTVQARLASPIMNDRLVARIPPSSAKHQMRRNYRHTDPKQSPCGTLESTTTDSLPVEYTRDRLQGAIERVRSTALSRGSMDQPFRGSAPELSNTTTAADNTTYRSESPVSQTVAKHGGAVPTRRVKGDGNSAVNYDVCSFSSESSSGRGSKPASIIHSHRNSLQEELEFSQAPSGSSGFGSRETSNLQSTLSTGSSTFIKPRHSSICANVSLESPQSEPSMLPHNSLLNPLNISVDENYEFDSVSHLDSELLDKLKHYGSRRGSSSSGERGVSDSELYTSRGYPKPKRRGKYDNTEARCNALKQEFLRFRQKQEEKHQHKCYEGYPEMESAC